MTPTLPARSDSSRGRPKHPTKVVCRLANQEYRWARQYEARNRLADALSAVAFDAALADQPAEERLRQMLAAVAPERRWALAGSIARQAVERVAIMRAGGATPRDLVDAVLRVLDDAAHAQIAGLRFLFGGAR